MPDLTVRSGRPSVPRDAPKADPVAVVAMVEGILSIYPRREISEAAYQIAMAAWRNTLSDLPAEAVGLAFEDWTMREKWAPTPSEIRGLALSHIMPAQRPKLAVDDEPPAPRMTAAEARRIIADASIPPESWAGRVAEKFASGLEAMERGSKE